MEVITIVLNEDESVDMGVNANDGYMWGARGPKHHCSCA